MKRRYSMLLLGTLACAAVHAAPSCEQPKGIWKSAFGYSIEIVSINARTKQINGAYVYGEGRSAPKSPLTGFWLASPAPAPGADYRPVVQISFALPEHGTITSWTGTCSELAGTQTLAFVTHAARTRSTYAWDHVIAASDYFAAQR